MIFAKFLTLATVVSFACAEVINFKQCPDTNSCTIKEVRIDPCPEAASHTACHLRRRKPATMSFDFTPDFDADALDAKLVWIKDVDQELPLLSLEKDGCKAASCPLKKGDLHTYTINVPIESKFPLNTYTIKWTLTAPDGNRCCFSHDIKVVR